MYLRVHLCMVIKVDYLLFGRAGILEQTQPQTDWISYASLARSTPPYKCLLIPYMSDCCVVCSMILHAIILKHVMVVMLPTQRP